MIPIYWLTSGVLVFVLAGFGAARCPGRSGIPLTLGGLGLGLSFGFIAGQSIDSPAIPHALLSRLLWITLLTTTPLWMWLSLRLGRELAPRPGRPERIGLVALWGAAAILAVGGLSAAPVVFERGREVGARFLLAPPFGSLAVIHAMTGIALALWTLHATLMAARASGRRRVSLAVYSIVPLAVASFYLLAETLLYEQIALKRAMLVMPVSVISLGTLAVVLRRHDLGERSLSPDRQIGYSPTVPIALGICLVLLALVAQLARGIGLGGSPGWQEGVSIGILAVVFVLWVFTGLREEIGRFADRGIYAARSAYKDVWQRVDHAIETAGSPAQMRSGLEAALRATLGPLHVQIWLRDDAGGDFVGVTGEDLPALPVGHALRQSMEGSARAWVMVGGAAKVEDVPLYLACESLEQRYGLRVFCPIPSREGLLGILGCGPAGGRTFHPEDIELLRLIGERLGTAGLEWKRTAPASSGGAATRNGDDDVATARISPPTL